MYLHIPPTEMWEMPFYDILYLYKAYSDYVDETNKHEMEQQAEYEEQMRDQQQSQIAQQMPKIPDYGSMTREMMNNFRH